MNPFCQTEFANSWSDRGELCGRPAVIECEDCGQSYCAQCHLDCSHCGKSFCLQCYAHHTADLPTIFGGKCVESIVNTVDRATKRRA